MASPGNSASKKLPLERPPFEPFYIYVLLTLIGYFVADTAITAFRGEFLPTKAPTSKQKRKTQITRKNKSEYQTITKRNIFNSDGIIPPALTEEGAEEAESNEEAVPSQLPLNLVGTIVHFDKSKSVATIQSRSNNKIKAYKNGRSIESLAEILEIERKKVIFRNLNNGRKEFIQIKDDMKINFGLKAPVATGNEEVQKDGNRFRIKRSDVTKYTSNLPELLQQARAVPNILPGDGGVDGFKIMDIQEGSIFEKLGLKRLDIIKGVNGEAVDSPAKAMELYNALKSSSSIDLDIERNGRVEKLNYRIE